MLDADRISQRWPSASRIARTGSTATKGTQANYDVDAVSYEEFVDKELIEFSR